MHQPGVGVVFEPSSWVANPGLLTVDSVHGHDATFVAYNSRELDFIVNEQQSIQRSVSLIDRTPGRAFCRWSTLAVLETGALVRMGHCLS